MEDKTKPVRVAFLIPAYNGTLDMGHAEMWLRTGVTLALAADKFELGMFGCGSFNPVAKARNSFTAAALAGGADWLVMIDADTYTETPEAIFDMIAFGIESDIPVMTAAVMGRGEEGGHPLYVQDGKGFRTLVEEEIRGKIIGIERCGAAMLAINMDWIRKHWSDGPWFVHPPTGEGEDWYFTAGVIARGGAIAADGRFRTCHVKGRTVATWASPDKSAGAPEGS